MSHLDPGPLATYNSLADPNLIGYFGNTRMRKHLRKSGLITRNGEIVSETTYRLNMARKEHKKHVREMLAQVIVHKALDMERGRQTQIRKKLEEISKIELVRRIRNERARRGDEELLPYLSPRLPRSRRSSSAPSTQSQRRFRPTSAPSGGADQYPIHIDASTPATQKKSQKEEKSREEIITPTPPKSPRSGSNTPRRWLKVPHDSQGRPFKMSNRGSLALHREEPPMPHRVQVNSNCKVKMHYHGSNIHLDYEKFDPRDHVIVEQQHCGGNTLIVFSEKIEPGSDFEFISKRHYGYPFSLTLYIDGVKDSRVSACCEYRHRMGQKLGSKLGHFSLISISGASPCYKCNLEKKFKKEKPKKEKKEKPPAAKEDQRKIVGLGDDKDTGAAKYKVSVEEEVVYSSDHETYTDEQNHYEEEFEEEQAVQDDEKAKLESENMKNEDDEEAAVIAVEDEEGGRSVRSVQSDDNQTTSPSQVVMVSAAPTEDSSSDSSSSDSDSSSSSGSSDSEGEYSDDSFEEEDDDAKDKEKERKSSESDKEVKYLKPEAETEEVVEVTKIQNETEEIPEDEIKNADVKEKILDSIVEEEIINGEETEKDMDAEEIEEENLKALTTPDGKSQVTDVQNASEIAEEVDYKDKSNLSDIESDLKIAEEVEEETKIATIQEEVRNGKIDNITYESATSRSESSYTSSSSASSTATGRKGSKTDLKADMNNTTNSEKNNASNSEKYDSPKTESEIENAVALVESAEAEKKESVSKQSSESTQNDEQVVNSDGKKSTEEETNGPHSGSGEDTLKMQVAEEMKRVLEENNDREEVITPRSDTSESSATSSMSSRSSSFVSDAETEDKLTALKKKAVTSGVELQETTTDSELGDQAGGNDPDNVINGKNASPLKSKLEASTVRPGSIRPLVDGKKEIDLTSVNLTNAQVHQLSESIRENHEVETLILRNGGVTDEDIQSLTYSLTATDAKLKMLNFNCNDIGPIGVSSIVDLLKEKRDIEMLLLHGNPLGDEGVKLLIRGLENLHVTAVDNASKLEKQASDHSIEQGNLEEKAKEIVANVIDKVVESESGAASTSGLTLTQLDLGDVHMTDVGAVEVARLIELNTNISTLSLTGSADVGIDGWKAIGSAVAKNHKLETLSLDYCDLSSERGKAFIAGLRHNKTLTALDLEGNKMQDDCGLELLNILRANRTLRDITLMPGNEISEYVQQRIKTELQGRAS